MHTSLKAAYCMVVLEKRGRFIKELSLRHYLQHSGTRYDCGGGLIGTSAVIKYHQMLAVNSYKY